MPALCQDVGSTPGFQGQRGVISNVQCVEADICICWYEAESINKSNASRFFGSGVFSSAVCGFDDDSGYSGGQTARKCIACHTHPGHIYDRAAFMLLLVRQCRDRDRIFYGGGKEGAHW